MKNLYLVPLRARHVRRIAPFLREADKAEALALDGRPAIEHLMEAVDSPQAFAIMDGSVPCGACGYLHFNEDETDHPFTTVWMVGTPRLTEEPKTFIKESREWIKDWLKVYDSLENFVYTGNVKHIRWLHQMGATFHEEWVSPTGHIFRHFKITNV